MTTIIQNPVGFLAGKLRHAFRPGALVGFATAALSTISFQALAQTYTITDLGDLGGGQSYGRAINNYGQVVGTSQDNRTYHLRHWYNGCEGPSYCKQVGYVEQRPFLWMPQRRNDPSGRMIDLGTLGGPDGQALAINNRGQVVGRANTGTLGVESDGCFSWEAYLSSGFLWDPSQPNGSDGMMTPFIPGYSANAVNDAIQVVWGVGLGACLWQSGVCTQLGSLGGGHTVAVNINDLEQVVGSSYIASNGPAHAFLWQNGSMMDLGTLPGEAESRALAISTNGQVVGASGSHAFMFTIDASGTVTSRMNLGTLPASLAAVAYSINNSGQVLGSSTYTNGQAERTFLWDRTHGMRDLNSLVPAGSGWVFNEGRAINDAGQILGTGLNSRGQSHAFLLTPQLSPELTFAATQLNGQLRFTLVGEAGRTYTIQASTNLLNWIALTNFVSGTGTNQFTDPATPNFNRRFYRALTQ